MLRVPEQSCAVLTGEAAAQVRAGTTCKNAACKAVSIQHRCAVLLPFCVCRAGCWAGGGGCPC